MVTKTQQEMDEMREQIQSGELPPDAIKKYYEDEAKNVYGIDAKKRRDGTYEEQGYGSAKNQTRNSIEAYKKYHASDVDYERTLARLLKELAESDARRAAERRPE
jgi:hypothetical protein